MDELLRCHCAALLLSLRLFPNAKEVSESFGAYAAVRAHLNEIPFNDPTVTLIAVGDGCTPRTGATFAMRSAWRCVSVDPRLRQQEGVVRDWRDVRRLETRRCRVEQTQVAVDGPVVVVAVHSHATLEASLSCIVGNPTSIAVVAMPCCVSLVLPGVPIRASYEDPDVMSPHRRIVIWPDASDKWWRDHITCGRTG
jgi:hypothetical protein